MHAEDPEPDQRVVDALLHSFFTFVFHSGATCTERALAMHLAHELSMCHLRLHPASDVERYTRLELAQRARVQAEDLKVTAELQAARS